MKKRIFLCDIDGTISRKTNRHYYQWESVNSDEPILEIITLVKNYPADIIILTGRNRGYVPTEKLIKKFPSLNADEISEIGYTETYKWVNTHLGNVHKVIMKDVGSFQKSSDFKVEQYLKLVKEDYTIDFIIDDNQAVCDAFRNLGVLVLQVTDGKLSGNC